MRTTPAQIRRRPLEGKLGLTLQFSKDHFGKKRRPVGLGQNVVEPANPDAFNFNKVSEVEKLGKIAALPDGHTAGSISVTVLANVSPLAIGHVLLVPRIDNALPQVLTQDHLLCGLHLLGKSAREDFRLVFNSLQGFASVNNFHWHGLYLDSFGLQGAPLPIEKVPRVQLGEALEAEARVELEAFAEGEWYIRGFVVSVICCGLDGGETSAADFTALAAVAGKVISMLHERNVPHNVVLTRARRRCAGEVRVKHANNGLEQDFWEDERLAFEVLVVPRLPEGNLRDGAGFNAAVMELSGVVPVHSEETYSKLQEQDIWNIMQEDVSLSEEVFRELSASLQSRFAPAAR